eukprot:5571855-Pleurochrysis_carterae.AAC.1
MKTLPSRCAHVPWYCTRLKAGARIRLRPVYEHERSHMSAHPCRSALARIYNCVSWRTRCPSAVITMSTPSASTSAEIPPSSLRPRSNQCFVLLKALPSLLAAQELLVYTHLTAMQRKKYKSILSNTIM